MNINYPLQHSPHDKPYQRSDSEKAQDQAMLIESMKKDAAYDARGSCDEKKAAFMQAYALLIIAEKLDRLVQISEKRRK